MEWVTVRVGRGRSAIKVFEIPRGEGQGEGDIVPPLAQALDAHVDAQEGDMDMGTRVMVLTGSYCPPLLCTNDCTITKYLTGSLTAGARPEFTCTSRARV